MVMDLTTWATIRLRTFLLPAVAVGQTPARACCRPQYDFPTKQLESRNGKFYKIIPPPLTFLHTFRIREVVEIISWRPPETHNVTVQAPSLSYSHWAPEFLKVSFPCHFLCSQTLKNVASRFSHDTPINAETMRSINKLQYSKQILNSHATNDRWWIFTRASDR